MSNEHDKRQLMALESVAVSLNSIATTLENFHAMVQLMLQHAARTTPPQDKT